MGRANFGKEVLLPAAVTAGLHYGSEASIKEIDKRVETFGVVDLKDKFNEKLLEAYKQTFPLDEEITEEDLQNFKNLASQDDYAAFPELRDAYEQTTAAYAEMHGETMFDEYGLVAAAAAGFALKWIAGAATVLTTINYARKKLTKN